MELRRLLLPPRDDLLAVVREFLNPKASRSGLDRCLRRHGVGNLKEPKPAHRPFKADVPGYLHIDANLPQMADQDRRRYLFVATDRAIGTPLVRVTMATGKEVTDRLFGLRKRAATGTHAFDRLCADFGIEHRLAPPMRPQTNGLCLPRTCRSASKPRTGQGWTASHPN